MIPLKEIGKFDVSGNKIIVTDPCYELGTSCQYIINNVISGTWNGFVGMNPDGRVKRLVAIHSDYSSKMSYYAFHTIWWNLGVDSGTMAICDLGKYSVDDTETDKYWHAIDASEVNAGLVGKYLSDDPYKVNDFTLEYAYGICSQSGYGDGNYHLRVATVGDNSMDERVYAICIDFI